MSFAEAPSTPIQARGHGGGEGPRSRPAPGASKPPSVTLRVPGFGRMRVATDRVRARPALTPQLSMMIGMTAIGLGVWGALFPNSVRRTLGLDAPGPVVRTAFGARELMSGFALAADPTRADALWARVGGDAFDLAVLGDLSRRGNPQRRNARLALAFVAAVTALDVIAAVRMSTVRRNCPDDSGETRR